MRALFLILAAAALGSCASAPPPPTRTAQKEQQLQRLLAGKIAQPPVTCLPSYNADDMQVIDENTIAFRNGTARVYVAHMRGGCSLIDRPGYALLTKQFGGSGLCRGDIAQVVDPVNRVTVGSCVFGEITPYVRPR